MALGIVAMLIVSAGLVNLQQTIHVLTDVEAPTLAAAYEMEINTWGHGMAVLRYLHRRDPQERERAANDEADFERFYAQYVRLANTDRAHALVRRLREEYERFRNLGRSMMVKRDRQDEVFTAVVNNFEQIDDLIDREVQARRAQPGAIRQISMLLDMETKVAELGVWAANYRRSGLGEDRSYAERNVKKLEQTLADFKRDVRNPDARPALHQLDRAFEDVIKGLAEVEAIEARLQTDSRKFAALRNNVDDLLDDEIQADALKELAAPRQAADRATRSVIFVTSLLMPIFLFAIGAVGVVAEARLRKANVELSRQTADRERAEEEQARLQVALRRSEVLSALGSIVAGVSHEVRNPLFGISSTVDALEARLKRDRSEGRYARHVQVLRGELVRLSKLMHDLLDYGKPQSLDVVDSSVADAVTASVAACESVATSTGATIVTQIEPGIDLWPMDRARIEQVLANLLENAIQHSAGGTVRLDVHHAVRDGVPHLQMQVRDQGPGFDAAQLAHVFEPFFTRRCGGTGLGLSIVERIVDAHGGSVRAANCPTGGAEITVDLPHPGRTISRAEVVGAA